MLDFALRNAVVLLASLTLTRAVDYATIGEALQKIPEDSSHDVTLNFDAVKYVGPSASFTTRGYPSPGNLGIPGPTIRITPGKHLKLTLNSKLGSNGNAPTTMNEFRDPNTTNIHTHGLHVSSAVDDVFVKVLPGESHTYHYEIPKYHMPGTHWYHPHHHGSTALQAGGGAAGIIIVEDTDDFGVPDVIRTAPEFAMLVQAINVNEVSDVATDSGSNLFRDAQILSGTGNLLLVNGQTNPKITIQPNTWVRLRMVMASIEQLISAAFDVAGCELQLIAKDGVYLHSLPREIQRITICPGGRADVMLRCAAAGTYVLTSAAPTRRRRRQGGGGDDDDGGGGGGGSGSGVAVEIIAADVFTVVVEGVDGSAEAIATTQVRRPCYLVDLRSATPAATWALDFGPEPRINDQVFVNHDTYLTSIQSGVVHEWSVTGIDEHPFHLHITPYQLQTVTSNDPMFEIGDWHDVFLAGAAGGEAITARFQTESFAGKMVIHCHILEHEDEGMMGVIKILPPAAHWSGARLIDPQCLESDVLDAIDRASMPAAQNPGVGTVLPSSATMSAAQNAGAGTILPSSSPALPPPPPPSSTSTPPPPQISGSGTIRASAVLSLACVVWISL